VAIGALRASGGASIADAPGLALSATLVADMVERREAPNVVGILRGADPALRDEYLVYSAHMDHVGVARDGTGCVARGADSICNGADDNASGTAVVMTVAEAFAAMGAPPRRSVVFLIASGEENGLRGSDWFAMHPPAPLGRLVADLNADDVGRNRPEALFAIGLGLSDLGATLRQVLARQPELGFADLQDGGPLEEGYYTRSDHYSFARRGVPFLFLSSGIHEDLHQPSDEVERLDADKAARIGRLLFHLGLQVANAEQRPRWDPAGYRRVVEPAHR
jgi:Zn-dependent M28 family amino/carboxypeptidase